LNHLITEDTLYNPTITVGGFIIYRSNFEKSIARNLEKRGEVFEYESVTLPYWKFIRSAKCKQCGSINVGSLHTYTPDFLLIKTSILVEAKGNLDSKTRTKMLAVKASNPDIDLRFLFMYDNWITKKHKARYSDWCIRNNFLFAFMEIPEDWL